MKSILKFNFIGILLVISLLLFGVSLILTYYDKSINNYLLNATLFLSSVSFLITVISQSKKENKK